MRFGGDNASRTFCVRQESAGLLLRRCEIVYLIVLERRHEPLEEKCGSNRTGKLCSDEWKHVGRANAGKGVGEGAGNGDGGICE